MASTDLHAKALVLAQQLHEESGEYQRLVFDVPGSADKIVVIVAKRGPDDRLVKGQFEKRASLNEMSTQGPRGGCPYCGR